MLTMTEMLILAEMLTVSVTEMLTLAERLTC